MRTNKRKTVIVADDVRVVRASEVVWLMEGKTIREVASELGVAPSNVHAAIHAGAERQ